MAKVAGEREWNDQTVEPAVAEFVISVVEEKLASEPETELRRDVASQSALPGSTQHRIDSLAVEITNASQSPRLR